MKKSIKKCFILLLSTIIVLSTCFSVMIASAATTEGFTCDFEGLEAGTTVTSAFIKSVGWNGASGELGTIVNDEKQGTCLHWTSSEEAGFNLGLGGEVKSGVVRISFLIKRTGDPINNMIGINSIADAYAATGTSGTDRATLAYFDNTLTPVSTGNSGGKQPGDCTTANLNTWYRLSFEINMDTRKFICYVNDTPSKNSYNLCISDTKGIQSVYFFNNDYANIYIDDIVVTHEDTSVPSGLGFTCDFETLAAETEATSAVLKSVGWNGSTATVGKIVEDTQQGKCLYYTASEAGFDLGRDFGSGIVELSFMYKRTNEANGNMFFISTISGAKDRNTGVTGTTRGKLAYHGPQIKPCDKGNVTITNDVLSTSSGKWVKLKFVIDMDTRKFTTYVNENATKNEYTLNIADTEKCIRSFFFFTNETTNFYIDDIVVRYWEKGATLDDGFSLGDLKIKADGTEITGPVSAGDEITVDIKALNIAGTKKVTLVYASYNGDKLVDVKLIPVDITSLDSAQTISSEAFTVKDGITVTETKAFVWDSTATLLPLGQSVKYAAE